MSGSERTLPDDLGAVREDALGLLARGALDRRAAFHTPVLSSVGLDGGPRARVVVLRAFCRQTLSLRIHSDARSSKCAELRRDPRAGLTFYDGGHKVQLRVEGTARLHQGDAIAQAAWSASQPMSRRCYATSPGPGTPLAAGGDFTLPVDDEAADAGQAHFVALLLTIERLEWLYLAAAGHRRALLTFAPPAGAATWLTP
jgi:pyridoxamine 5'-phosphate oxidase